MFHRAYLILLFDDDYGRSASVLPEFNRFAIGLFPFGLVGAEPFLKFGFVPVFCCGELDCTSLTGCRENE